MLQRLSGFASIPETSNAPTAAAARNPLSRGRSLNFDPDRSTASKTNRSQSVGVRGVPVAATTTAASRTKDTTRALERALEEREYCFLLLQVLPELRSENQLLLTLELILWRKDQQPQQPEHKLQQRDVLSRIANDYLLPTSETYVGDIHLQEARLSEANVDATLEFLLGELVKLPQVLDTLRPDDFDDKSTASSSSSSSSSASTGDLESKMDDVGDEHNNTNAQVCATLARIIASPDKKRSLLDSLVASNTGSGLMVRVRFVGAVDQYLACKDKAERRKLERMVRKIFLTKGGMFSLLDTMPAHCKLDLAREMVLRELSLAQDVMAAITGLADSS